MVPPFCVEKMPLVIIMNLTVHLLILLLIRNAVNPIKTQPGIISWHMYVWLNRTEEKSMCLSGWTSWQRSRLSGATSRIRIRHKSQWRREWNTCIIRRREWFPSHYAAVFGKETSAGISKAGGISFLRLHGGRRGRFRAGARRGLTCYIKKKNKKTKTQTTKQTSVRVGRAYVKK